MGNFVQVVYWGSVLKRNEGKIWAKVWFQAKSSSAGSQGSSGMWIIIELAHHEARDPAFVSQSITQGPTLFGENWIISMWVGSFWPRTVLVLEIWRRGQLSSNIHRQQGDGTVSNKGNLGRTLQTWPIILTWEMRKGGKKMTSWFMN